MNLARRRDESFAEPNASQEARSPMESVQKLIELVNSHPDQTLMVVRRWLTPGEIE